jgi:hypothetical protein
MEPAALLADRRAIEPLEARSSTKNFVCWATQLKAIATRYIRPSKTFRPRPAWSPLPVGSIDTKP